MRRSNDEVSSNIDRAKLSKSCEQGKYTPKCMPKDQKTKRPRDQNTYMEKVKNINMIKFKITNLCLLT